MYIRYTFSLNHNIYKNSYILYMFYRTRKTKKQWPHELLVMLRFDESVYLMYIPCCCCSSSCCWRMAVSCITSSSRSVSNLWYPQRTKISSSASRSSKDKTMFWKKKHGENSILKKKIPFFFGIQSWNVKWRL